MNFFAPAPPWPFDQPFRRDFNLCVVDPPWVFQHRSPKGWGKSAEGQYKTMPTAAIAALPIGDMAAADCLLLLWITAPRLPDGLLCLESWGFTYKSNMIWRKVSKNGKPLMGTGHRVRTMHEQVLVGTIGNPKHKPFPSVFDGLRREHSRKPDRLFSLVEEKCPGLKRRADVFARSLRPGWVCYGDELEKFTDSQTIAEEAT